MHVHAGKHQFVHDRRPCACTEDCLVYVHTWKFHFLHNLGLFAYAEGCVVYVFAWKRCYMFFRGLFTCTLDCLMLVHARNLQFMYLRSPSAFINNSVRYLYVKKHHLLLFMIDSYACAENCVMYVHVCKRPKSMRMHRGLFNVCPH